MTYMPPQLTSSSEIPRLVQRTLPVLLGLALVGIAPACTLIGVEPDEIDLITGETGTDSLTSGATTTNTGTDSAGEGTDSDSGDGDGDAATGDGDGDPTGADSDTDPTGSDSDTDTSGETDDTDTGSDTDTTGDTEEPGGNCGELIDGELTDGSNDIVLEQVSAWEDPCGIGESLGAYAYVPSADGTLTVTPSGFTEAFSLAAYGPECAEEFQLSNACNAALDVPVLMGQTIYLIVQAQDAAPVMGNLDLAIN